MSADPSARDIALLAAAALSLEPGERSAYPQGAYDDNPSSPAVVGARPAALSPGTYVGPWQVVGPAAPGTSDELLRVTRATGVPRTGLLRLSSARPPAALVHHNIARLIEAGVTPDAGAFVVIEDVDGMPVEVYCDLYTLTIADRLHVLRAMCAGLQYAHSQGVTHAAIGPASVVVSASGVPTWLDLVWSGAGHTSPTHDPDTGPSREAIAADIRGLGRLLCGLLAGRHPAPGDVPLPSALARADTSGAAAMARRTTARGLVARLSGDLDAIVVQALTTSVTAGYVSIDALAADLERHRTHHPVLARRQGWAYVARRFARRHGVSLTVLVVLAALLVALA